MTTIEPSEHEGDKKIIWKVDAQCLSSQKGYEELSKISEMLSTLTTSTQLEMTRMQSSSRLDSLSSSLLLSTQQEAKPPTENNETSLLSLQEVFEKMCQTSSLYDLIGPCDQLPNGVSMDDIMKPASPKRSRFKPYISIKQIKDYNCKDRKNQMKPAIEIGFSFEF